MRRYPCAVDAEPTPAGLQSSAGRAARVVIAEDEALIRMDLVEMLAEEGYDVVGQAADGVRAIELAEGGLGWVTFLTATTAGLGAAASAACAAAVVGLLAQVVSTQWRVPSLHLDELVAPPLEHRLHVDVGRDLRSAEGRHAHAEATWGRRGGGLRPGARRQPRHRLCARLGALGRCVASRTAQCGEDGPAGPPAEASGGPPHHS